MKFVRLQFCSPFSKTSRQSPTKTLYGGSLIGLPFLSVLTALGARAAVTVVRSVDLPHIVRHGKEVTERHTGHVITFVEMPSGHPLTRGPPHSGITLHSNPSSTICARCSSSVGTWGAGYSLAAVTAAAAALLTTKNAHRHTARRREAAVVSGIRSLCRSPPTIPLQLHRQPR